MANETESTDEDAENSDGVFRPPASNIYRLEHAHPFRW